jgi:O-antigen ligase
MLQAGCGIAGWLAVILGTTLQRQTKQRGLVIGAVAVLLVIGLSATPLGEQYVESVREFTDRKFRGIDVHDAHSVGTRYQYFWGVLDIFMAHPLVGVGYTGFYDAVILTPTYLSGFMADEGVGLEAQRLANPHNAFLYYIAGNGVMGLVLGPLIFLQFVLVLRKSLWHHGTHGTILWVCIVTAYFVNAMTLPTLFNTEVLYVAAAVAFVQQRAVTSRLATQTARRTWSAAPAY